MEEVKSNKKEHVIVFSKVIKAGKRVYYIDVKETRSGELFLTITESKRRSAGEDDNDVQYEKHKIFLYPEDFDKFKDGLADALGYIDDWNEKHPEEYQRQQQRYYAARRAQEEERSADGTSFDKERYNVEMDF